MSLNILQLGPYPPPEGGVTRNLLAIRDAVQARGGVCSIIATTRSSEPPTIPNVSFPRTASEMVRLLRRSKFDILHLHVGGDLSFRVLGLMCTVTFFARKRSVLTVHSGAYPLTGEARAATPRSIRGAIFRSFGRIIAVNEELESVFERFGVPPYAINKIPPFVLAEPDGGAVIPEQLSAFFVEASPLLLSVGGLEPDYDPSFQTESMEDVWNKMPNARLLMVGGGSLKADVEKNVARSSRPGQIMVAGNVEHAITLHLIARADILLRTTRFDGDAISVHEALHLGTPVIATDNGMRPDGVHLIDIGDRKGLARKVEDIVSAGSGALPRKVTAPTSDNIGRVIDLYEELIEGSR